MPENLPGVSVWGRPIKPVALGFCVLMVVTLVYNILDAGVLGPTLLSSVVAVLSTAAATTLALGWWASSQRLAELGLLAAAAVEVARGVFVLLTLGPTVSAVWGSLTFAIIAGGSYLLESWNPQRHHMGAH